MGITLMVLAEKASKQVLNNVTISMFTITIKTVNIKISDRQ